MLIPHVTGWQHAMRPLLLLGILFTIRKSPILHSALYLDFNVLPCSPVTYETVWTWLTQLRIALPLPGQL